MPKQEESILSFMVARVFSLEAVTKSISKMQKGAIADVRGCPKLFSRIDGGDKDGDSYQKGLITHMSVLHHLAKEVT